MEEFIIIDGVEYHARARDEGGELIPRTICICAAHSTYECCCGAWDIPLENTDVNSEEDC